MSAVRTSETRTEGDTMRTSNLSEMYYFCKWNCIARWLCGLGFWIRPNGTGSHSSGAMSRHPGLLSGWAIWRQTSSSIAQAFGTECAGLSFTWSLRSIINNSMSPATPQHVSFIFISHLRAKFRVRRWRDNSFVSCPWVTCSTACLSFYSRTFRCSFVFLFFVCGYVALFSPLNDRACTIFGALTSIGCRFVISLLCDGGSYLHLHLHLHTPIK